jgi:hypothetical protein
MEIVLVVGCKMDSSRVFRELAAVIVEGRQRLVLLLLQVQPNNMNMALEKGLGSRVLEEMVDQLR